MKLLLLKDELEAFITSVKKSVFEAHIKFRVEPEKKDSSKLYWVHFDIEPNDIPIFLNEIWRAGVYFANKINKNERIDHY